jgi:hypothetical protein
MGCVGDITVLYYRGKFYGMRSDMYRKAGIAVVAIMLLTSNVSRAQLWFLREVPEWLTRYEIGYSYPMAWADYSRADEFINPVTGKTQTSSLKIRTRSSSGFGLNVGTYFPVKRVGLNSVLAISVGLTEAAYTWSYPVSVADGFDESGNMRYASSDDGFSGVSVQIGVPIGADLKFGCDAFSYKEMRFCGTVGAGILPAGAVTADYDNAGLGFGMTPYLKLEGGVMAGICMKLRVMVSMGKMPFYDDKHSLSDWEEVTTRSSLIGRQSVTASLILMPFSWRWQNRGWAY